MGPLVLRFRLFAVWRERDDSKSQISGLVNGSRVETLKGSLQKFLFAALNGALGRVRGLGPTLGLFP